MRITRFILFFSFVLPVWVAGQSPALHELDLLIARRAHFDQEKMTRINALKADAGTGSLRREFFLATRIFDEYKSFLYDSAFRYALKLQDLADRLGDPVLRVKSKIDLGFTLVSAGMFNETLDTLQSISGASLPDSLKAEYYFLIGRTCYDLTDFNRDDFYRIRYKARGNAYLDSALSYLKPNTPAYWNAAGLRRLHADDFAAAQRAFEEMMSRFELADRDLAVAASTLSFIYNVQGERERSKEMLIAAAMADIRSSTKEAVALMNLAEILYQENDIKKAYGYVRIAMDDANFYGANHRRIQVARVFPVIEGRQLALVEARKNVLTLYAAGITVIVVLLVGFGIVIYQQFRKLQAAKKVISESNEKLTITNHQLLDSNKIKEEYVTYYFNTTAEYISRLENLKKTMEMKLLTRKVDELKFVVDSINIKRERDELYHNFDKVFLKLFPDFVTVFQSLFREEDRIHLKDGQLLNTELRIFALIRMGIHDNDKISRILDYSVTTIYTYKTRIRNKSIVPNDEFDRRIMAIPTI